MRAKHHVDSLPNCLNENPVFIGTDINFKPYLANNRDDYINFGTQFVIVFRERLSFTVFYHNSHKVHYILVRIVVANFFKLHSYDTADTLNTTKNDLQLHFNNNKVYNSKFCALFQKYSNLHLYLRSTKLYCFTNRVGNFNFAALTKHCALFTRRESEQLFGILSFVHFVGSCNNFY